MSGFSMGTKPEEPVVEAFLDNLGNLHLPSAGVFRIQQIAPGVRGNYGRDAAQRRAERSEPSVPNTPGQRKVLLLPVPVRNLMRTLSVFPLSGVPFMPKSCRGGREQTSSLHLCRNRCTPARH